MHWLAASNYDSAFADESKLSERVLFPAGPTESHGMEDARFVRFVHDDGAVTYSRRTPRSTVIKSSDS